MDDSLCEWDNRDLGPSEIENQRHFTPVKQKKILVSLGRRGEDFGTIAEPYFDLDFDEVFYLTDNGRKI